MINRLFSIVNFTILTFLCINFFQVRAQTLAPTQDIGAWIGLDVAYGINKWTFSVENQARTHRNAIELEEYLAEIGVFHDLTESVKIGGNLRYSYARNSTLDFRHNIRYNVDVLYKKKLHKKLSWNSRLRFQHRYTDLFNFNPEYEIDSKLRFKTGVKWNPNKKNTLYFTSEIFRSYTPYTKGVFDVFRFKIGDELRLNTNELDLAIAYQIDTGNELAYHFLFVKIAYSFRFKND